MPTVATGLVVKGDSQGLELYGVWSWIGDRVDRVARVFPTPLPQPIFSIFFVFLIFFIFLRYGNILLVFTLIFSVFDFIFKVKLLLLAFV